jgi:hypothetical protein
MKRKFDLSRRQEKLFFYLGVIYSLVGGGALIGYVLRDLLGIEIGIHGALIPLSLLLIVGAGLLIMGRAELPRAPNPSRKPNQNKSA